MATFNAKSISENKNDISLVSVPAAATSKFCEVWPTAKTGLELLTGVIKNPVLKVIIGTVVAAGDAVASRIC
jgi:hypothetical protein